VELALFGAHFGDVDVEVADRERLFALRYASNRRQSSALNDDDVSMGELRIP
jgi:hypothetical protein